MKKKLFTYLGLAIISLFVGFTQVNAESNVVNFYNYYNDYQYLDYVTNNFEFQLGELEGHWMGDWSFTYEHWYIYVSTWTENSVRYYNLTLQAVNTMDTYCYFSSGYPYCEYGYETGSPSLPQYTYNSKTNTYTEYYSSILAGTGNRLLYRSDIAPVFKGCIPGSVYCPIDKMVLPSYTNNDLDVSYPSYELFVDDEIPTYYSLSGGIYDSYQEINLNNYEYVILSLKDYNQDTFWTNIYTLGRLCLTPVYNYGMTPRQEVLTGTQIQGCTISYDTFTPVNVSIIQSDIENHAVYYVKAYENETTKIKVSTSVFDIAYVTSQNASNPTATIEGRSYPVIPYTSLTDTANISTATGYISGQVCNPGDINCASTITGIDISDLWTSPLQLFKTVGNSITSVLGVITAFITFLPPTLQAFMYTAFFLVVILGILKILL